jgi:hypothetical protein
MIEVHDSLDKICHKGAKASHQNMRHVALKRGDMHVENLA